MPQDHTSVSPTHTTSRAAAHSPQTAGIARPSVDPVQKMKEGAQDEIDQPASVSTAYSHHPVSEPAKPTASFQLKPVKIALPASPPSWQQQNKPIQRMPVMQMVWTDVATESGKAQTAHQTAIAKITAKKYSDAIKAFKTLKEILGEMATRNYKGTDGVTKKPKEAVFALVKEVVERFTEAFTADVEACKAGLRDLSNRYQGEYIQATDDLIAKIDANQDVTAAMAALRAKGEEHKKAVTDKHAALTSLKEINDTEIAADTLVEYDQAPEGSPKKPAQMLHTKLNAIVIDDPKALAQENIDLVKQYAGKRESVRAVKDSLGADEDLRKDTALLLMADSPARKAVIEALIPGNIPRQRSVFATINRNHRKEDINNVKALIETVGVGSLDAILTFITAVGAKGTISAATTLYTEARAVKETPAIAAINTFVIQVAFDSLPVLTKFVKGIGAAGTLDEIKSLWAPAKAKDKIDEVIALFKPAVIPDRFAAERIAIGLSFLAKTGKSTAADWGKILKIAGWKKESLVPLAETFDADSGGVTADRWVAVADADADEKLQAQPKQVRATAKLNDFANADWYDNFDMAKGLSSPENAKKKYTQLLYAIVGDKGMGDLGGESFDNIQGDLLSMVIFFHRHIASSSPGVGGGFDRDAVTGKYARSDADHPLNTGYARLLADAGGKGDMLQPINASLLGLQNKSPRPPKPPAVAPKPKIAETQIPLKPITYAVRSERIGIASAGLPAHNLKVLGEQQALVKAAKNPAAAKAALFNVPAHKVAPEKARTLVGEKDADITAINDSMVAKQKAALGDEIKNPAAYGKSFHDGMLKDRGVLVKDISRIINTISGGAQVMNAIGSEDHPSILFKVPKDGDGKFVYAGKNTYGTENTKPIINEAATDFNSAPDQLIKVAVRGSFGFQRPTLSDTGDSIRLWPGYTPVELLIPGLKVLVEKLNSKKPDEDLDNIDDLDALTTNFTTTKPLYVEALKTAMRHAFIALEKKLPSAPKPPDNKKRIYEWLRTRLLIKLQQSGILITKTDEVYKSGEAADMGKRAKHFQITADMTDKIQEYTMLYTAVTLDNTVNPNENHTAKGKFNDGTDVYEKRIKDKLGRANYRMFYVDSGEQALITAGLLANRFQQGADETTVGVARSNYISRNPYFEISLSKGDARSNLKADPSGKIVHADLAPVITSGIDSPQTRKATDDSIKETWQTPTGAVKDATIIPILDITNSSIDSVVSLGALPTNFIIVESLTKHQQLGADKFIMGRLIAVSNTAGTAVGPLVKTNFLDLAQKIVGPIANKNYNPLLSQIRKNMDKALYTDDLA